MFKKFGFGGGKKEEPKQAQPVPKAVDKSL